MLCERVIEYDSSGDKKVRIDIKLPYCDSSEELAYIILRNYSLSKYEDKDLISKLRQVTEQYNLEYYECKTYKLLENYKSNFTDADEITKQWEKLIREETVDYADNRCATDDEVFATAYHKLVHSPALDTMFQVENMYSQTVKERFDERNDQITLLTERQTDEMNRAFERLESGITEFEINEISARHFDDQTFLQVQLTSELDTIKEAQRREYREWLMQCLEQKEAHSSWPTPKSSPLSLVMLEPLDSPSMAHLMLMEESFTIHLGSQLKQMHNIRILSCNVLDLCARNSYGEMCPQLLQTALGLYSNDLCGLVLMTDNVIHSRFTKDFTDICQASTEFHFPHIDNQLEQINEISQKYPKVYTTSKLLQLGDVYITRHSNLSHVHVIFHVVSDDSVSGVGTDINSRHPVLLGLRNILKSACSNDITCITVPLLLQYEMSEEMTIAWCAKRAELVFKCVKGFMIEMASLGGSDMKTVQFLVPQGISSDMFHSLTTMLPSIFKVSTPLVLTSNR